MTEEQIEEQIQQLSNTQITINVSPAILDRLLRKATFVGLTLEEHVTGIVCNSLEGDIGSPVITGPSSAKSRKITGPSWMKGEVVNGDR